MARFKRKAPSRRWFIAAMGMIAAGALSGYIAGGLLAPKPVACEPVPNGVGAMREGNVLQRFRMEDCEDGSKRMVPDGFIPLRGEEPSEPESEGPKSEL